MLKLRFAFRGELGDWSLNVFYLSLWHLDGLKKQKNGRKEIEAGSNKHTSSFILTNEDSTFRRRNSKVVLLLRK
jgi:hypothetical protein